MELYERLVRSTGDAVIAADSTGRIVLCNRAAEEMFGYDCGFLTGKRVAMLIPEHFAAVYEENFADAMQAGRTAERYISLVGKHADGHQFPVEVAVAIDGAGDDAVAFGIVRKVDERFEKLALLRDNERRLRDAENLASVGSFELDVATGIVTWSDELYRIFGCDPSQCPSTIDGFLDRVHPGEREAVARKVRGALESGTGWTMDEHIVRVDTGEVRTLLSKVRAMRDAEHNITRLCGTCQDVTDQRRAEYELAASESRFRRSFDYAAVGMLLVELIDGDGVILRMNTALARLLGIPETAYTGMTLSELVVTDDWPLLHTILDRVVRDGQSEQVEVRLCGNDGRRPMVYASAARIGDAESPRSIIVHIQDITERKAAEEQLRHRALHDPLTGLPNRTLLLDRLDLALARAERAEASVAVLFLDVDNFKLINDTVGHAAGDHMLRAIAKRIVDAGRVGDTAARVGGDEFVVVCENIAHEDEVLSLATRLSVAVAAPISVSGAEFISSVSIGVAMANSRSHTPGELLRDADLAMYRAKQQGKNAIEIFDDDLRRHAMQRVNIERELRTALNNDEIVPYYQPIVALETGKLSGFEALARWKHPTRGLLLPREFLPVAEETHLIGALGTMMLRDACARLASWQKAVPALTVAVNLSLRQLDGRFADVLVKSMQQWEVAYSGLLVEVTESVLLDIHKSAVADLHAIAEAGVRIGIDDFGTGYSSLLYLKRFPVGFLKVDRSFVEGMPEDQDDIAIVSAIVRLAQSLGLATVAEGVETQKQMDLLQRLGCTYAQGNFIAPPLPAYECEKFLDGGLGKLGRASTEFGTIENAKPGSLI